MSRWFLPGASRARWPLALLLAAIAVTAIAAWEATRAVRSHRALAEQALREYATFAAWSYQQHLRETLERGAREVLGAVNHNDALHTSPRIPAARELAHYLPWDQACTCHRALFGPNPAIFFGFTLGADTLGTGVNRHHAPEYGWEVDLPPSVPLADGVSDYSPADRAWIVDTLTRQVRSSFRSEWGFAYIVADRAGEPRLLVMTLMPTEWGDTLVYGAEYSEEAFAGMLGDVLDNEGLLPAAFTAGRRNRNVLDLRVTDRHDNVLFASSGSDDWRLDATNALPASFGGLVVRAQIRPALAGDLVIGGLPRSRLPFLLGLLGLAAALAVVAVAQLRREGELARERADFVSSVSHELRTPLAQIRLFLETLRLGRARTEEQRAWTLDNIDRETKRLSNLVENVLRFSRSGRGGDAAARIPTDVATEAAEVASEFAPLAASRRARVVFEGEPTSPIPMRPDALRQVLVNLLDNAVKYGPPGQTVHVRVTGTAEAIRLSVTDEGAGVGAAERELIWRPFQRGSAAALRGAGGSGIGLTVVREIVQEHGGSVRVEDAPGGGAAFVVEFPWTNEGDGMQDEGRRMQKEAPLLHSSFFVRDSR